MHGIYFPPSLLFLFGGGLFGDDGLFGKRVDLDVFVEVVGFGHVLGTNVVEFGQKGVLGFVSFDFDLFVVQQGGLGGSDNGGFFVETGHV